MYDLKADPLQKKDILKQLPEVTNRLKKKLLTLYKYVMADAPAWPQNEPPQHMLSRRQKFCIVLFERIFKSILRFYVDSIESWLNFFRDNNSPSSLIS